MPAEATVADVKRGDVTLRLPPGMQIGGRRRCQLAECICCGGASDARRPAFVRRSARQPLPSRAASISRIGCEPPASIHLAAREVTAVRAKLIAAARCTPGFRASPAFTVAQRPLGAGASSGQMRCIAHRHRLAAALSRIAEARCYKGRLALPRRLCPETALCHELIKRLVASQRQRAEV